MSRQLKFRTGKINASGKGKPFIPRTKTYNSVCCGHMHFAAVHDYGSGAQEARSAVRSFNLTDYNTPIGSIVGITPGPPCVMADKTLKQHPTGHEDALAQGYDEAQILSSLFRFTISFQGGNDSTQDYVFCHKFTQYGTTADIENVDTTTSITDQWADIRMSKGWVWKRFSATNAGGSIWPCAGVIDVRIPSIGKLVMGLNEGYFTNTADKAENFFAVKIDDDTTITKSYFTGYLTVLIFSTSGASMAGSDVQIEINRYDKVKLWRQDIDAEMIDEVDIAGA